MIDYIFLALTCFLSVEIIFRLKFFSHIHVISRRSSKVLKIISSSIISDHWKERVVPAYALIILKESLIILGILGLVILTVAIFSLIASNFLELLLSFEGVLTSLIISFIYYKLRNQKNE